MAENYEIRQLIREDISELRTITVGSNLKWGIMSKDGKENPWIVKSLDGVVGSKEEGIRIYGLFVGGSMVAAVSLGLRVQGENHQHNACIKSLYTHPNYRRMGYGKALLRYAEGVAEQFGDDFVTLFMNKTQLSAEERIDAQLFIVRCGYGYESTVEDNDVFGRRIKH